MPAPGDILLGKYRVERVLGQGGMGVVLSARHLSLGELFAVKVLLPEALAHDDAEARFLREARAAASLRNEHVVKVVDVGRLENGVPFMVMEHLHGSDLKAEVRRRGPLPEDEVASHVIQCCDALAEAHALGIVHRDLKPANLFVTRRVNGTACVKVLDFGISKLQAPESFDLTKTGTSLGSPHYMAPEQMARTKNADARSDIWSLGVVLYELVVGRVPFTGESITEVVAAALQEPHVPPSQLRPDVSAAFDAIVDRCLQKRPEHRYQRVEELSAALRALGAGAAATGAFAQGPTGAFVQGPTGAFAQGPAGALAPVRPSPAVASYPTPTPLPLGLLAPAQTTGSAWGTTSKEAPSRVPRWIAVAAGAGGALAIGMGLAAWLTFRGAGPDSGAPASSAESAPAASGASSAPVPSDTAAAAQAPTVTPAAQASSAMPAAQAPSIAPVAQAPSIAPAAQAPSVAPKTASPPGGAKTQGAAPKSSAAGASGKAKAHPGVW